MIEQQAAALAPAIGGAVGAPFRTARQTSSPGTAYNPHRLRVYLGNAENFPQNADTLVNFDTATGTGTRDPMNGFNTSAHSYTVQPGGAGTWLLMATAAFNAPAVASVNQQFQASVYINGVKTVNGPLLLVTQGSVGSGYQVSAFVIDELDLSQGDTIAIHLVCGATGGTATAITGSANSYWSMRLDNAQGG